MKSLLCTIFTFCSACLTCLGPQMCLFIPLNGGYYHIKTNLHMLSAILSRCDHEARRVLIILICALPFASLTPGSDDPGCTMQQRKKNCMKSTHWFVSSCFWHKPVCLWFKLDGWCQQSVAVVFLKKVEGSNNTTTFLWSVYLLHGWAVGSEGWKERKMREEGERWRREEGSVLLMCISLASFICCFALISSSFRCCCMFPCRPRTDKDTENHKQLQECVLVCVVYSPVTPGSCSFAASNWTNPCKSCTDLHRFGSWRVPPPASSVGRWRIRCFIPPKEHLLMCWTK